MQRRIAFRHSAVDQQSEDSGLTLCMGQRVIKEINKERVIHESSAEVSIQRGGV